MGIRKQSKRRGSLVCGQILPWKQLAARENVREETKVKTRLEAGTDNTIESEKLNKSKVQEVYERKKAFYAGAPQQKNCALEQIMGRGHHGSRGGAGGRSEKASWGGKKSQTHPRYEAKTTICRIIANYAASVKYTCQKVIY